MNQKSRSLVAEFVLENIAPVALDAYGIVAQLKYPVSDKHSLTTYLDELQKQLKPSAGKDKLAINLVRATFDVGDFPIETPRGGLEKFERKLRGDFDLPPRPRDPEPPLPGDRGKRPKFDPWPYFRAYFPKNDCAVACAVAHYNWEIGRREFPDEWTARHRGIAEGKWCAATGFCRSIPDGLSSDRPLFYCTPGIRIPTPIEVPDEGFPFPE